MRQGSTNRLCLFPVSQARAWTAGGIFVVSLAILIAGDGMYGITYDEPIYQSKAVQALDWLGLAITSPSLAASRAGVEKFWQAKDQHPGFIKLWTAICGATVGTLAGPAHRMRAGTNVLAALCLAGVYLLTGTVWGNAAGWCAASSLLLMPRVFAHCHLAALDAPIMSLSFLTVAAAWMLGRGGNGRWRPWLWAAVCGGLWGLALGTKLNAFFVPFIVLPWCLIFVRRQCWRLAVGLALMGPLAFWVTWPWLWYETVPRFIEYFRFHLHHYPVSVMYLGQSYAVAPWHYAPVMLLVTTPVVLLALALVGLGRVAVFGRCLRLDEALAPERATLGLVLWALAVNMGPLLLPGTPKYGGVRLFLPAFPYVAILAGVGFAMLLKRLLARTAGITGIQSLPMKLTVLALLIVMVEPLMAVTRFSPYHLSYYNALIGGLPGATRAGMEPTYWGDTYLAASLWLARNAPEGATVWIDPVGFESTVRLFQLMPMRPDIKTTSGNDGFDAADFAVTQNKPIEFSEHARELVAQARPVYTDGIDGVPLVYVFDLRGGGG